MNKEIEETNKRIEEMAKCCPYHSDGKCGVLASQNNDDCDLMCMMHGAFARLVNAGYRKQEWIPVDERMPDPNEYDWVLVAVKFNEDGTYGVPMVAEFRRGKWWESGGEFSLDELFLTVTHWMPLPETPKGESDER